MSKACTVCGKRAYSNYCFQHKKRKPIEIKKRIRQVSDKQSKYHRWLEDFARPALIARDGNNCSCCGRAARQSEEKLEKLDIEHTLNKGSHPSLKQDMNNLTLMCRYPCHYNKTNHIECNHSIVVK